MAVALFSLTTSFVHADMPILEQILNCAKMGAHTPRRDEQRFVHIERGKPVGQTFVVSDEAVEVFRIAIWQAFWHETWQPDESLVLTLWDSPQKKVSYGRCAIPYNRRMWEGAVPMFTIEAKLPPSQRTFYFELNVEVEPLRPAVEDAEWVLGREARPGFAGGDGRLDGIGVSADDYQQGTAFVGGEVQGFDLWFEVHEIRRAERDALYQEAFALFNLDYPPLQPVREAVEKKDWDDAVRRLVSYFESRQDLIPPNTRQPVFNPDFDTREADLAAAGLVPLPSGLTVPLGPHWSHFTLWPERGGVGLTRAGLRKTLAGGYANTGNEKYARAFSDMLYHFFRQHPSPLKAGVFQRDSKIPGALPPGLAGGSVWSGLSIGARMGHGFAYYGRFVSSPYFPLELRAAFIFNLAEMAEVLERMEAGGNWEAQMSTTLVEIGLDYPEFAGAKRWIEQGVQTLIENARHNVYPDGVLNEPTTGYHMLVMARYRFLIKRASELGITLPPEIVSLTEKMHEYILYATLPDGTLPIWGDGNPPMRPDALLEAADIFHREDFRFAATSGREGKPPVETSKGFPHGGFFYMRTDWTPSAHYMGIRCGPHGSHGHWDALSVVVASFGRLVLVDPGVYVYGTPQAMELMHTRSHSTVCVDDRRTARGGVPDLWATSTRFDFFAGHNEGYEGLTDVRHHRRIWFLKPHDDFAGLWLILDDVIGAGEHTMQVRFRFGRVSLQTDADRHHVWTADDAGNLSIMAVAEKAISLTTGRAIAVLDDGKLTEAPVATFSRQGSLPLSLDTVLVPFRGQKPPAVSARRLETAPSAPNARAIWLEQGSRAWLVYADTLSSLRELTSRRAIRLPDGKQVQVSGASAVLEFVRRGRSWSPTAVMGVRLQEVRIGAKTLFAGKQVLEVLDNPVH